MGPAKDLMTQILLELFKNHDRYRFNNLPLILKKQFGPATLVHKKLWIAFKQKYDLLNEQAQDAEAPSALEWQSIVSMKPSELIIQPMKDPATDRFTQAIDIFG